MKARISYDNVLTIESENEYELEDIARLMSEGAKHGLFVVGTALGANKMTGHIGVDNE